jgi:hypothetical protein
LCGFIVFLPSDSIIAAEVCGRDSSRDQSVQINQRREINLRRPHAYASASHRIGHPSGDRHHDTRRA